MKSLIAGWRGLPCPLIAFGCEDRYAIQTYQICACGQFSIGVPHDVG